MLIGLFLKSFFRGLKSINEKARSRHRKTTSCQTEALEIRNLLSAAVITPHTTAQNPASMPPVLTVDTGVLSVVGTNVTPVSPGLVATDPVQSTFASATVQITGNYQAGEDRLVFTNTANIHGSWNAATGTLTLMGTDTVSNYQSALRTVSYVDVEDAPNISARAVTFIANDGLSSSAAVSRTIAITPVHHAPVVYSIEPATLQYVQASSPVNVTSSLLVVAPNSDTLASATVQITSGYSQGADLLSFVNTSTITGTWNASTGTLTLSGTDSVSNYRVALRSITFFTSTAVANPPAKTVTFQVNDGTLSSGTVARNIVETPVPNLFNIETTSLSYTVPNSKLNVTLSLQAQVFDSGNLTSAQVQVVDVQSGDLLSVGTSAGIQSSWNASTGILTLTGSSPAAVYQVLLGSVTYSNPSSNPSSLDRQITFQVFEGNRGSNVVSRDINFTASNDRPQLSLIESTPLNYVSQTPATPITSTINVFDPDRPNLTGAVIQFVPLTGDYRFGQDLLQFVNTPTITGTWTPATGKLTLSGTDTVANYMAALRSVTYLNTAKIVSPGTRVVSFAVADGSFQGAPDSNTLTRSINVTQ